MVSLSTSELWLIIDALEQHPQDDGGLLALRLHDYLLTHSDPRASFSLTASNQLPDSDSPDSMISYQDLASRKAHGFTRIPSEGLGFHTLNPLATSGEAPIAPTAEPPVYPANCPRNSKKLVMRQWTIGANMARTSITSSDAVISALAAIHPESNPIAPDTWIASIRHYTCKAGTSLSDNSLIVVVKRCTTLSCQQVGDSFITMVSYIQLAAKCQR
jgi:hypothetical protein